MRRSRADTLPLIAQPGHIVVVTVGVPPDEEELVSLAFLAAELETTALPLGDVAAQAADIAQAEPDLLVVSAAAEGELGLVRHLKALTESHFIPVLVLGPPEVACAAYDAGADHVAVSLADPVAVARARALVRSGAVARMVKSSRQELRLRRDWVRYLVHDLRNLLTKAIGQLSCAQLRGRDDPPLREALLGCEEELWRGTALLGDFLDVDRIRKGSLILHRVPTDLVELAHKVAQAYRDASTRAELEIRVVADGDVAATVDGGLIERVLGNLVANALRFARKGGTIAISVGRSGDRAVLSVENPGPSIPPEDVPRLFEPFVSTSEIGAAGTGLGLAFCRLVAEMHDGSVSVAEPEGGGARFVVVLPVEL